MSRRRRVKKIDPCIDIVIGNNHKKGSARIIETIFKWKKAVIQEYAMEDINRTKEYEELHLTKPGDDTQSVY